VAGIKKVNKISILVVIFLLMTNIVFAGENPSDTIRIQNKNTTLLNDSVSKTNPSAAKEITPPVHSPKKAAMYSAILPGMGQAYNKKYWKIPLVYGGFATLGYFISWNNKEYTTAKQAYMDLTDKDPDTNSYMKLKQISYYNLESPSDVANLKTGLTSSQDYYRRNRDLLIIITVAFYGLNIIDASVDGHFFNFDISDDLTMKVQPALMQQKNQNIFCLNCTFNF
jgi:hypothetical protein